MTGLPRIAPALVTTLALECDGEPRQDHEKASGEAAGRKILKLPISSNVMCRTRRKVADLGSLTQIFANRQSAIGNWQSENSELSS